MLSMTELINSFNSRSIFQRSVTVFNANFGLEKSNFQFVLPHWNASFLDGIQGDLTSYRWRQ